MSHFELDTFSIIWLVLKTLGLIILWKFLYNFIIKPFLLVRFYAKQGFSANYTPLAGILAAFDYNASHYGDCFYDIKKKINEDPNYKGTACPLGDACVVIITDPKTIREFSQTQAEVAIKDPKLTWMFRLMHPKSYNFKEGDQHKIYRNLLSKVFHFDFLRDHIPTITQITNEVCTEIMTKNMKNIDVLLEVGSITGEAIGRLFFGAVHRGTLFRGKRLTDIIPGIFLKCGEINLSAAYMLFGPKLVAANILPSHREINSLIGELTEHCLKMVKKRKQELSEDRSKANAKYILDMLLIMQLDKTPEALDDEEITHQYLLFFTAGQDTSAHLTLMSLYNFARHPEYIEVVRNEIKRHIPDINNIQYEDFPKLEFLMACVKESQRMFNPAQMILPRLLTKDCQLGGHKFKKGTVLDIWSFYANCNEKIYKNPRLFDPSRWLPGGEATQIKDQFSWLPFWAGVRNCIGQHLALMETRIMLIHILTKFNIKVKDGFKLKMNMKFQYSPIDPIIMEFEKIN